MRTCLIVPNRDGRIEPHCWKVLGALRRFSMVDVIDHESTVLLEFFRSEAMERAFRSGYQACGFLDSDCSAPPDAIMNFILKTAIDPNPQVRAALFPERGPGGNLRPVGFGLEKLEVPFTYEKPVTEQRAPKGVLFGAGLVAINKQAFERLCAAFPETAAALSEMQTHPLWKSEIHDGRWWGEDLSFFRRVHHAEIPVWLDPICLAHGRGSRINTLW